MLHDAPRTQLTQDVFEDARSVHLVMDLCEGGALLERISSRQYSEKYIARLSRSILRFVSQCHAKGIIYRDIKVNADRGCFKYVPRKGYHLQRH